MPVWHELTRELRESGDLVVIGVTQEQHPDRARLFARWHGIDWPILWDPFNLTGSAAVPMAMGVDERGVIVRGVLNPRRFEDQVLDDFMKLPPARDVLEPRVLHPGLGLDGVQRPTLAGEDLLLVPEQAISRLLFYESVQGKPLPGAELDHAIRSLRVAATSPGARPAEHFRLGVALRLRYDSPHRRPEDFQGSLDSWIAALMQEPSQYIWRRRIQQWGPRLDKPYPFYDWVDRATEEIVARGEEPPSILVPLTGSEVAGSTKELPLLEAEDAHPDPDEGVPRDPGRLVRIESAAALHTGVAGDRVRAPVGTSRIHVVLRPDEDRAVHWSNDAGPTLVWVEVPEGWNLRRNLHVISGPGEVSDEVRRLDFEVRPPLGPPTPGEVRGIAFYYVCEGKSGECTYLAQEFVVPVPLPAAGAGGPSGGDGGR